MGEPTRVAVLGATGRMGRRVLEVLAEAEDLTCVASVARTRSAEVSPLGPECFGDAEVVIDFSLPEGLRAAVPFLGDAALVSGTTGLTQADEAMLDRRSEQAAVLHAANFSLGIELLRTLVRRATAAFPYADIEIVETHHRRKVDSPSGTALLLGRAAALGRQVVLEDVAVMGRDGSSGARASGEIGVHALRGGDVVGDHVVHLLADGERLALTHRATSRATFAYGAVRAASWIVGRPPGRFVLSDVLGP